MGWNYEKFQTSEELCARIINFRIEASSPIFSIILAGVPATGKSTLANLLSHRWKNTLSLEIESYIYSREYRQAMGLTGCEIGSYDVITLQKNILDLYRGENIKVRKKVFSRGKLTRHLETLSFRDRQNVLFILSGPIACLPEISTGFNKVFFFTPCEIDQWLHFSVDRDIRERGYTDRDSTHSLAKAKLAVLGKAYYNSFPTITNLVLTKIMKNDYETELLYNSVHSRSRINRFYSEEIQKNWKQPHSKIF